MSERLGKIRCDECVYAELMYENTGIYQCHRWPPHNQADWPRVNGEDWCGEFKRPEIAEQVISPVTGSEMLESVRASLRDYPNAGGDVVVMAEVDRIVREAVNAALEQAKRYRYKMVGDTVQKVDKCVCNGVGCNSCEPGGRG